MLFMMSMLCRYSLAAWPPSLLTIFAAVLANAYERSDFDEVWVISHTVRWE